ncbi:transcriptional regulator with XRE-family HTH domain [Breznakia sp. PF5-3]|uniref:helix-turn-helix domain-containing protein n=1 Tax=unclassified Breznakia TaxID=2623764 RepID=UPI002405DE51|nr:MULTISPECIES: helix-turn-helix transcriptional regulator [unclassified Breznakia]MDF9825464.1 transcriptional regulator with XRE-family HTH domain [Breznakia sp. PM6-1]MDF9836349.1 transcriptional regulator with XRE-family HTH domain [Breznakia sp. PF5-3]MDF9838754.1 transcriptional regulator with XRE-family HTH domain [Breznakia sp. PFB2-8]MDF9860784.1 transcriptional regulator with XRE-family HTH domain [Breznakia sp. PH5-24]
MKEIKIADTITLLRKEKNVSQETLATFLGVSKAAVSKWETAQSYPDIELLPRLATYFNISVDELLQYSPQLSKYEIKNLYDELANAFASQPYEEVIKRCRLIVKEYYSCYPLLLQIGALYLNYSNLAPTNQVEAILHEAIELFIRIKKESNEVELSTIAQNLEATALLMTQKPKDIIALLGEETPLLISTETILASALQMLHENDKAEYNLQISIYQYVLHLSDLMSTYLSVTYTQKDMFIETYHRLLGLIELFQLKKLHPTKLLNIYLSAAIGFMNFNDKENALEAIQAYVDVATDTIYPLELHGDAYFTRLDEWFSKTSMPIPRDQESIRKNIIEVFDEHPAFVALADNKQFQSLMKKLKKNG